MSGVELFSSQPIRVGIEQGNAASARGRKKFRKWRRQREHFATIHNPTTSHATSVSAHGERAALEIIGDALFE